MGNFVKNTDSAPLRLETPANFVYSGCTRSLKSIHQKTKVINAKAVICNLLFPCQILTLWRFTACLTLITDTVAWRGKGRKDWKCSASSNSRPWVGYYLKMLLKLMLQLKTCVSDCRLTATAQNETGLKKLMLTIFPFLIHFLSPSVNDIKSGGKKRRKMWRLLLPTSSWSFQEGCDSSSVNSCKRHPKTPCLNIPFQWLQTLFYKQLCKCFLHTPKAVSPI